MSRKRNYWTLFGFVALILSVNLFLYFYGVERVVSLIGVENAYLVIFLIATIGGLSALTGTALITNIATFASGGADLLYITLAAGLGIFISDSIFYVLATYGRRSVPENWEKTLKKMEEWVKKYPTWLVLVCAYVYMSATPFPSDVLMVALVLGGYSYKKVAGVIFAAGFTLAFIVSYLGASFL
jgi:membrane protein DedA with SNARE-associated domain